MRPAYEMIGSESKIKGKGIVFLMDPMIMRPIEKLKVNRLEEDNPVA